MRECKNPAHVSQYDLRAGFGSPQQCYRRKFIKVANHYRLNCSCEIKWLWYEFRMRLSWRGAALGLALLGMGASPPQIRVALWKNQARVTVAGEGLTLKFSDPRYEMIHAQDASITIVGTTTEFQIGDHTFAERTVSITSTSGHLTIDGKKFKGVLEVQRDPQGKLLVLNQLDLEDYLVGLVHSEIASTWPAESIKAQAVAARTYALFRQKERAGRDNHYDLESGVEDQVYQGTPHEDPLVEEAVAATQGEVLWYFGVYPAYFHSCCGGMTETASHVWDRSDASVAVADPFCQRAPYFHWETKISQYDLLKLLWKQGLNGKRIVSMVPIRFDQSPRAETVEIKTDQAALYMRAVDFRQMLGTQSLRSTWFDVSMGAKDIIFRGTGYGHGVGLCQWGAKGMADVGKSYRDILQFYYPKATLRKVY